MKGLLLKDWYMMKQYCRTYPVIAVAFMALSLVDSDNLFFVFYPCLLCGMIPVILLGYDERSGWVQYSGTMPYTKIQIVSEKYLISLFAQLTMLVATGIAQAVKMTLTGGFILGDFAVLMLLCRIICFCAALHFCAARYCPCLFILPRFPAASSVLPLSSPVYISRTAGSG